MADFSIGHSACSSISQSEHIISDLARLRNGVDSLADADLDGEEIASLVDSEEHARAHSGDEQVEKVWIFAADRGLHIQTRVHQSQQTCQAPRCSAVIERFITWESRPQPYQIVID
jgi:hypothetical protein